MLILAAFSRHETALRWAQGRAGETWGPAALESPVFDFAETSYYDATMGPGLKKQFFTFVRPFDPANLVEVKLLTKNGAGQQSIPECRFMIGSEKVGKGNTYSSQALPCMVIRYTDLRGIVA